MGSQLRTHTKKGWPPARELFMSMPVSACSTCASSGTVSRSPVLAVQVAAGTCLTIYGSRSSQVALPSYYSFIATTDESPKKKSEERREIWSTHVLQVTQG